MNLYEFTSGQSATKTLFTTAKADVTVNDLLYKARSMRRTSYSLDSIETKNNLTIMFPGDDDFARDFIHPTTDTLSVTIALLDGTVFYRGKLVTVAYNPNNTINMTFEPAVRIGLTVSGEKRLIQPNCPFMLYGTSCNAIRVRHDVVVTAVAGQDITVAYDTGKANNYLRPNSLIVIPGVSGERIPIGRFVGGIADDKAGNSWWIADIKDAAVTGSQVIFTITLLQETSGMIVVDYRLRLSLGCRRNREDCANVHDNIANYGGFPGMTRPSAFDGGVRGSI